MQLQYTTRRRSDNGLVTGAMAALIGVVFAVIGYWMGPNSDDYLWALRKSPLGYWTSPTFLHYDGRYFGNSLATIGLPHQVIAAIIYGGTIAVLFLMFKLLTKRLDISLIVLLAAIWPTHAVYAQTFGWKAGFFNYVISLIVPCLMLYVAQREVFETPFEHRRLVGGGLFLAVTLGCFFSEPITLLLVVSGLAFLLIGRLKGARGGLLRVQAIAAGIGAVLMFINPGYRTQLHSNSGRSLGFAGINANLEAIIKALGQEWVVFTILALALIGWTIFERKQHIIISAIEGLIVLGYVGLGGYVTFTGPVHSNHTILIQVALWLLVMLVIIINLVWYLVNQRDAEFWLPLWALAGSIAVIAPYLVLQPFGARCEYATIVLLGLLAGLILANYLPATKLFMVVAAALVVAVAGGYLVISHRINTAKRANTMLIEAQKQHDFTINGHKHIYYVSIPEMQWFWNPRPQASDGAITWYYKIPVTIKGELIDGSVVKASEKLSKAERYKLLQAYDKENFNK